MGLSAGSAWSYIGVSRVLKTANMQIVDPIVREFILFCLQRQAKGWPALYDEMCRVAAQRLFRGLGYAELKELGLSFGLTDLDDTIKLVASVAAAS